MRRAKTRENSLILTGAIEPHWQRTGRRRANRKQEGSRLAELRAYIKKTTFRHVMLKQSARQPHFGRQWSDMLLDMDALTQF